jgi:hypothetical protein
MAWTVTLDAKWPESGRVFEASPLVESTMSDHRKTRPGTSRTAVERDFYSLIGAFQLGSAEENS